MAPPGLPPSPRNTSVWPAPLDAASGNLRAFGALAAGSSAHVLTSNAESRFRYLGSMRVTDVGGNQAGGPGVGAVKRTSQSRYIMMSDMGFTPAIGAAFATGRPLAHRGGWSALFVDGHVSFYKKANLPTSWSQEYRQIDALLE